MSKKSLLWDDWNKEHIKKHNVSVEEVGQAYKSKTVSITSYFKREIILGITKKGRLLTIVTSFEKQTESYVVSARDMSKKERRIYNDHKKNS